MKIKPKPGREFTIIDKNTCPLEVQGLWQGDIFATAKNCGIVDDLQLCHILGLDYLSQLKDILGGDFTSVKWVRVRV